MNITSVVALRELYPTPGERAIRKQLSSLDRHCRRFIELSPFLVLATTGEAGEMDALPRGGVPGFIKALDERTILVPMLRATTASIPWRTFLPRAGLACCS
jgi:predicted pyridoxine 5'-phosphate oxidase superfamily flavin-nucleotide-binding protein